MTVSTTTIKNSASGNGTLHSFAYEFKIFANGDLDVIVRSSTGTETVKSLNTDYIVTNAGIDTGGNVLFKFNTGSSGDAHFSSSDKRPQSGETVLIRRSLGLTQSTDYVANDPFAAEDHETALDRLTFITQDIQEQLDRSFKVSRTNTITTPEFTDSAVARASKTLGFDSSGNLTTVADFLPIGGDAAQFTYSTTTADADPGSGFIRFNNTNLSSASIAYVDDNEINGTDVSAWVQSFDDVAGNATNRGRIRMSKANTLDTWAVFKVSGAVTDASGYNKLALTYIDTAGTFANNDKVFLSFVASGEDGAIPGYYYKFATSTTDGDPGAGVLRFNNATYANVTEIYIDDADSTGGATQADTATWGSSTSTIKGFLHIVDINDNTTYARFKITAAVDDETGYNKITVVHLASNNTFSAADELSVHFTRTGLKGDTGSTGSQGIQGPAGDITGVTAGTNLSGGGNSGGVTINLADATVSAKGAASFATADFTVSSGAVSLQGVVVKTSDINTFTKGQIPSTNPSSGLTLNFDASQNFFVTLSSGSNTLAEPTTENTHIGQSGYIIFIQPSSGNAGTVSLFGHYETAGAGGSASLGLSATNNQYDLVPYVIKAAGSVLLGTPQLNFG